MGQDRLVDGLVAEGVIRHRDVEQAMRAVDRAKFAGEGMNQRYCYQDTPLPIGHNQTISAPSMHAHCVELLRGHLRPGARVLDVGSGSGYLTAVMALMVGDGGKVVGVDMYPELVEQSVRNVSAALPRLLDGGVVELRAGNVLGGALQGEAPFDAIHVGAAAATLPDVLVDRLRPGGRMVVPVGPQWSHQVLQVVDKDQSGGMKKHSLMGVRYVPLAEPREP